MTLNGGATITEKLYVPGTPTVRRNGNPNFGGVIEGGGSAIPTNYQVTLNGNATLGNLVNRTNPVALTPVAAPPTPTGTRDVSLNNPNDQIGDFATLRNLTLNGNAGTRSVSPGTYGNFTVNGSSVLIFGIANATEPAIYNLQGLTLNGGTQLQIVGPVTLTLRNGTNINGSIGNAANPLWLTVNISNGGVTLNGGSQMFGKVNAPAGSVTVNSRLTGNVICDRLTINGGGVVTILAQAPQDTTAPVITIAEPVQALITKNSPITVSGTVTDASAVTITINGQPVTLSGAQFSTAVTLAEGSNTITVLATDAFGNVGTASRSVTLDTIAPVLTITSPQDGATTTEAQLTITGTVTDATATTVTVNNVAATRNGNEFSAVVSLVEGPNTFIIRAEDAAGNQTETTRTITLQVQHDTTPPVITLTDPTEGLITNASPVTVSGIVTDASAVTVTVNNQPVTLSGTQFSASLTLTEGSNTITILAADAFGNVGTVSRTVALDTIAPVLTVTSPIDGAFTTEAQITLTGSVTDATTISVTVNDIVATVSGNDFSAIVPLSEGPNTLLVRSVDAAGNQTEETRTVNRQLPQPLSLTLFTPEEGDYSAIATVTVYGYATGVGVTVSVNGTSVPVDVDGIFLADIPAVEGTNQFRVIATDAGGATQEIVRSVIVDSQPPVIGNLSPAPETVIPTPTTTISGTVADTSPVRISINGISATATGGTFTVPNVPVREGVDYLRIVATDAANNTSGAELILVGKDRTPPASPTLFPITSPTRLTYQTIHGKAEPGAVISIGGGKSPVTTQAMLGTGIFVATVDLNPGANTLTLVATDADGNVSSPIELTAVSNPNLALPTTGEVSQVTLATGNSQFGLLNTELPRPLVVFVSDKDGNPVANVPVTFTVEYGGGTFINNATTMVIPTDAQGHAAARYVVGAETGVQIIQAEAPGNTFTPVLFFAEGREAFNQETSVSGVVMDQNLRALPNVLIRLGGQQTRTGGDGRFFLTQVAAGPHQLLEVIGRDEVALPGRWPNISYDIDVLPGVNNYQRRPLFLPKVNDGILLPLNASNVVTQDTTYELPVLAGEPPIRVTAKAGTQVLFPPDITDKRLSVTRILPSHIPMALEDGRSTRLYISVQPSGTLFDPPLEVSFPNLDREPANAPVLLMSFDHDAGRYVQVGTGHVSADGRSVIGDPGSGVRVGAWHAFPPPPPKPTKCLTGESGRCTEEVWSQENPGVPIGECPSSPTGSRLGAKAAAPSDSLTCYEVCGKTPDEMGMMQGTAQASCPEIRFIRQRGDVPVPAKDQITSSNQNDACLMVSKFPTAISLPLKDVGAGPSIEGNADIPYLDEDTFRVEVKLNDPNVESVPAISIYVYSEGKQTGFYRFGLVRNENEPMIWRTVRYIRFVSNQVDDEYGESQTIKVKLGDTVKASVQIGNEPCTVEYQVGRPETETGNNAIRIVQCNSIPVGTRDETFAMTIKLNETWAQTGIKFQLRNSPSQATRLRNCLIVEGIATENFNITLDITPSNGNSVKIGPIQISPASGARSALQIAQEIVNAINTKLGQPIAAHVYNALPNAPIPRAVIRISYFGNSNLSFRITNSSRVVTIREPLRIKNPPPGGDDVTLNEEELGLAANWGNKLIDYQGGKIKDRQIVDIIVVPGHQLARVNNDGIVVSNANGKAWPFTTPVDGVFIGRESELANTIVIVSFAASNQPSPFPENLHTFKQTLAHELGHLLTQLGHMDDPGDPDSGGYKKYEAEGSFDWIGTNLMAIDEQITDDIFSNKRVNIFQHKFIRQRQEALESERGNLLKQK